MLQGIMASHQWAELVQVIQDIDSRKNDEDPIPLLVSLTKSRQLVKSLMEEEDKLSLLHAIHAHLHDSFQIFEPHAQCLAVLLLHSNNPYVLHSSSKALLSISNYLLRYPVAWASFLQLLWNNTMTGKDGLFGDTPAPAHALLLFRDILKSCYEKGNSSNVTVFISLLGDNMSVLTTILDGNWKRHLTQTSSASHCSTLESSATELVLGAVLKILCSSVRILQQVSEKDNLFLDKLNYFLPTLSKHTLGVRQGFCISRFLRYKALMLLLRLSWFVDTGLSSSCLILLSSTAKDLLQLPLPRPLNETFSSKATQCSPFASKDMDDAFFSLHLQRRAVFVLFKTVTTLNKSESEDMKHLAATALLEWLGYQVEAVDNNMDELVLSIVHLYTDEDDLMLELLMVFMDFKLVWCGNDSSGTYDAFLSALAPLRVFHLFLAAIHYDHSVLIDFLISRNTGIASLQYLLRCVRLVIDSWPEFLRSSSQIKKIHNIEMKKRKRVTDSLSPEFSFTSAKQCLIELEKSIRRLHEKQLFPYNASVLLARLRLLKPLFNNKVDKAR